MEIKKDTFQKYLKPFKKNPSVMNNKGSDLKKF